MKKSNTQKLYAWLVSLKIYLRSLTNLIKRQILRYKIKLNLATMNFNNDEISNSIKRLDSVIKGEFDEVVKQEN